MEEITAIAPKFAKVRMCSTTGIEIDLAYETFGEPSNPSLLLIHGLNTSMAGWDSMFCATLAEQGRFHVIRFDNRDVGRSTKLDAKVTPSIVQLVLPKSFWWAAPPYTLADMADDAVALLDYLRIDAAHLVGVSMGGMIAQTVALTCPSRVLSLTSIMSTTGGKELPGPPLKIKAWFLRKPKSEELGDVASFRATLVKNMLCTGEKPDDAFVARRVAEGLQYTTYNSGHNRQLGAILGSPCREAKLRQCLIPTLVIHGDQDLLLPAEHGFRTASILPDARLLVIEGMGHYILPQHYSVIVSEIAALAARSASPRSRRGQPSF